MSEVELPNGEELGLHLHPFWLTSDLLFRLGQCDIRNPIFTQWPPADLPNSFLPLSQ